MGNRRELDTLPGLTRMLAGAATTAARTRDDQLGRSLPSTEVTVRDVPIEVDRVAEYAAVCGYRLRDHVPVTHPHLLGFPLTVWLLTRPDFPLGLVGLVHVRNTITATEYLSVGEHVDVTARTTNARPHPRGIQFDAVVDMTRDGHEVWSSTSTYLRRGPGGAPTAEPDRGRDTPGPGAPGQALESRPVGDSDEQLPDVASLPMTARWRLSADLGRRYAAVSGDRNPIHLTAMSARAFGFPRAIAHGMWTKAAVLASLGELPRPCHVDVAFRRPVLLPSRVEVATDHVGDGWALALRGRDGTPHLAGRITVG